MWFQYWPQPWVSRSPSFHFLWGFCNHNLSCPAPIMYATAVSNRFKIEDTLLQLVDLSALKWKRFPSRCGWSLDLLHAGIDWIYKNIQFISWLTKNIVIILSIIVIIIVFLADWIIFMGLINIRIIQIFPFTVWRKSSWPQKKPLQSNTNRKSSGLVVSELSSMSLNSLVDQGYQKHSPESQDTGNNMNGLADDWEMTELKPL